MSIFSCTEIGREFQPTLSYLPLIYLLVVLLILDHMDGLLLENNLLFVLPRQSLKMPKSFPFKVLYILYMQIVSNLIHTEMLTMASTCLATSARAVVMVLEAGA